MTQSGCFMYRDFIDLREKARKTAGGTVCVAAAADRDVLEAIAIMEREGIGQAILVGDKEAISRLCGELGIKKAEIVEAENDIDAAQKAVEIVKSGRAQVLMKGLVNTADFMRAVLNGENGLRTGRLISHLAAYEVPGREKLLFLTDGGMNIAPDLEQKKQILENAMDLLARMGIEEPKVAVLSANEKPSPKLVSSVDAAELVKMREDGIITRGIIEGPIALDVAISPMAAKHKGITSRITGDVDIFLVPNIDAGNIFGKTLTYFANAKMAGLILGASAPIVLTSRSDSAEAKFNAIVWALA